MYEVLISHLRECAKYDQAENTFTEAADAIEELSKPKWIPVTERLPDQGESVLVYRRGDNRVQPKMRIDVCPYLGDGIFCLIDVAYWMPLPEPPKEE